MIQQKVQDVVVARRGAPIRIRLEGKSSELPSLPPPLILLLGVGSVRQYPALIMAAPCLGGGGVKRDVEFPAAADKRSAGVNGTFFFAECGRGREGELLLRTS